MIAGNDGRDQQHELALQLFESVAGRRLVTTNHVRGETWTWLRYKRFHKRAVEFLDSIEGQAQHLQVAFVSEDLEDEALRWLRQHDEREYSFVDATSFAYMRAKGITEALAFDGDFAAAGFTELRP
ncbi:MAG TPA: PIN domain-containing protein [Solirubrobacterales bacterium]|nr:PIN domain-containing protein [Solirubrobacterales bacterium]